MRMFLSAALISGLAVVVPFTIAEEINSLGTGKVSTMGHVSQPKAVLAATSAQYCPSDKLPKTGGDDSLRAVMHETFEGTYSGEACWLDRELLRRAVAWEREQGHAPMMRDDLSAPTRLFCTRAHREHESPGQMWQ